MNHRIPNGTGLYPPISLSLASLSIMGSFYQYGFSTCFTFPFLRELSCHLWITGDRIVLAQESFFALHGPQLAALHLQRYYSSPGYAMRDLEWIKARCPALRELTIAMRDWKELPVDPVNMPPVEYLGLRCEREGLSSRHYRIPANFLAIMDEHSMRTKSPVWYNSSIL
ncbi:hypothetical protein F5I97DRAFT_483704 [Phlebopus sp. FC_14]|nr:hypothetical protein F5I97DRAFT_483704 [Phlebopus sp. FC_14]